MSVLNMPDFGAVLGDYLAERPRPPWHAEPSVGPDGQLHYYWHAHAIGGCPRAAILERAGISAPPSTNSSITMEQGTWIHSLFEQALPVNHRDITVITTEVGGIHRTLPLKAKPDAIILWQDVIYVLDYKTESAMSLLMRHREKPAVRWYHQIQVTAGAMVAESIGQVAARVRKGMIVYVSRRNEVGHQNEWVFDTQTHPINNTHREEVVNSIAGLDEAWNEYERDHTLPEHTCIPGLSGANPCYTKQAEAK